MRRDDHDLYQRPAAGLCGLLSAEAVTSHRRGATASTPSRRKDKSMSSPVNDLFGEVIFAYTDADALNDGVLVDISSLGLAFESKPINRITGNLFWQMQPDYPLSE